MAVQRRHIGGMKEALATAWLLQQGARGVFKSVSQHGVVDLVAIDRDGKLRLYDCKSSGRRGVTLTNEAQEMGVIPLLVHRDGTCIVKPGYDRVEYVPLRAPLPPERRRRGAAIPRARRQRPRADLRTRIADAPK